MPRLADRPLGDETRILPVPLVLGEDEHAAIADGVYQRATALQAFFCDVVLGEGRFLATGELTAALLDAILATEGTSRPLLRATWDGHEPEEMRFVHAPDLVCDRRGDWTVIEDNVGCVGGSADSFFVAQAFARAAGLPPPSSKAADLVRAVRRWLELVGPSAAPLAVLGCESPGVLENERRARLLAELGIACVQPTELREQLRSGRCSSRALVNFDQIEPRDVIEIFGRLRMPLLNAPGTGLLGNKALLAFVPGMIRFFCDAEPLLATAPTAVLHPGERPGPDRVVKPSTGAGGADVLLPGWDPAAVETLVRARGPSGVVVQRWIEPSTLSWGPDECATFDIELRPIAYVVGAQEIVVGQQPVAKAVPSRERRLNNVSRGAAYVAVRRTSRPCARPRAGRPL